MSLKLPRPQAADPYALMVAFNQFAEGIEKWAHRVEVPTPIARRRQRRQRASLGSQAALAEERRLLYVGITRARRHLSLTWTRRPSRFLAELGVSPPNEAARRPEDELPPGVHDAEAAAPGACEGGRGSGVRRLPQLDTRGDRRARPRTLGELAGVPGVGPAKLERYGADVLAALSGAT